MNSWADVEIVLRTKEHRLAMDFVSNPIRVLHIVRPATGGIRQHVLNLIRFTPTSEVTPSLAAPQLFLSDLPAELSIDRRCLLDIGASFSPVRDLRAAYRLAGLARGSDPDGRPYDVLHAHGLRTAWVAAFARKFRAFTLVYTAHNLLQPSTAVCAGLRVISSAAKAVIAVSPAVEQSLIACGVDPRMIRVVANGVDTAAFADLTALYNRVETSSTPYYELTQTCANPAGLSELTLTDGRPAFIVGCIARLSEEKGVDVLLDAARRLPETVFLIAGDGPERDRLTASAPPNTRLLGRLDDVRMLLAASDVVAVPSRLEGHGIVAIEAMAAGVPLVASDVGGLSAMLTGTDAALLVPVGDPAALADALRRLQSDASLRAAMAARGRELARANYDVHGMVEGVLRVYREVRGCVDT